MRNIIGCGIAAGFSLAIAVGALTAGIILTQNPSYDTGLPPAQPKIESLKEELPERSSLTLPVNGN